MGIILRAPSTTRVVIAVALAESASAIAAISALLTAHAALTVLVLLAAEATQAAILRLTRKASVTAESRLSLLRVASLRRSAGAIGGRCGTAGLTERGRRAIL